MGVLQIKDYIIAAAIFIIIILSGIGIMQTFKDNDNNNYIPQDKIDEFGTIFNQSGSLISEANNLDLKVTNASTDFGTFGVLNSLISTSWQGLKLISSSFKFIKTILYGPFYMFGIPRWLPDMIYAIVLIFLAFAIWDAMFGGAGR